MAESSLGHAFIAVDWTVCVYGPTVEVKHMALFGVVNAASKAMP
jgi:hypothetical protein